MRALGVNLAISCVSLFILAACQLINPTQAGQAPEFQSSGNSAADEGNYIQIYEETQASVVSVRRHHEGRVVFGSGFIIDDDGHILTNWHVVSGGGNIELLFSTGLLSEAHILGSDETSDLAVLAASQVPDQAEPLTLGETGELKVGQVVLAIGNPIGLQNTMTSGIISGLGRYSRVFGKVDEKQAFANASVIQTDAAINQGNSGGPLLDLKGHVVGITSARLTSGFDRNVAGIGFATSSEVIGVILPSLLEHGTFDYPYLGILSLGDAGLADLQALGLVGQPGIYVAEVLSGSPAESAGLLSGTEISRVPGVRSGGDLIIQVGDQPVKSFEDLMAYIVLNKEPGEMVTLKVVRNSDEIELELQLGSRP